MYQEQTKTFHCDICKKQIQAYEVCWTKWQFPPKIIEAQDMPIKALAYQNAKIICEDCQSKVFVKEYQSLQLLSGLLFFKFHKKYKRFTCALDFLCYDRNVTKIKQNPLTKGSQFG